MDGIRFENGSQVRGESQQWKGDDEKIVGPPPYQSTVEKNKATLILSRSMAAATKLSRC